MPERIAVVILSYNGLEDTRRCLASLAGQSAGAPGTRLVLVDNGSTDGTREAVEAEFPWCEVFRVEKNAGPAAGNNRGIEHVRARGADWVLLLNNDTRVSADFLARMRQMAEASAGWDILGPLINYMDEPDVLMTDGVRFNPAGYGGFFERVAVPPDEAWPAPITDVDVVNACCMMIRSAVFDRVGLFDEGLFIYHDETDFCVRARLAGFRAGVFARQLLWHKGSRSFVTTGKRFQRYYDARNLGYLVHRYAGRVPGRRGRAASWTAYLRHMYHRYCVELDHGQPQAADAVIEGVLDCFASRTGAYAERSRRALPVVKAAWSTVRRAAA